MLKKSLLFITLNLFYMKVDLPKPAVYRNVYNIYFNEKLDSFWIRKGECNFENLLFIIYESNALTVISPSLNSLPIFK